MKSAVIVFPGSNCDRDLAVRALYRALPLLTAHERAALSRAAAA